MKIMINGDELDYDVDGESYRSPDNLRYVDLDDDLTRDTHWHQHGFTVGRLFGSVTYEKFKIGITGLLKNLIQIALPDVEGPICLETYHELIKNNYQAHLEVISNTKLVDANHFPIPFEEIENRVSEICGVQLHSKKPFNNERVFHFRIIRPQCSDFNPLHKDVWQEENRNAINIYVPLVGSDQKSSLILAPGSHLLPENTFTRTKQGAVMNNLKFNVPGLLDAAKELTFIRPNPGQNEVLVFSPYLIHGGAMNLNESSTRISLEMRFWRK